MRILTVKNGITNEETEKILNFLSDKNCKLLKISNNELNQYCMTELKQSEAIYCISNIPGQPRHAFLLAKKSDGTLVVLDGQSQGVIVELKNEAIWASYNSELYDVLHTLQE
jgi:hypothetical protein